jgi:phosphate:Na+ symporter
MNGNELFLTLIGGVGLLLWGVRMVRTGMTRAFSGPLRIVIARASSSRVTAFLSGVGITGILQSSTATALLLASFAGRGLIAVPVALAVMLGADVGTTIVAQFFAFDVKWLWAVTLMAGVVAFNVSEDDRIKAAARVGIGLGLMLLALSTITGVSAAMRSSPLLSTILAGLAGQPVAAIAIAAVLTWLAHSSLAMILFVMSLAASGAVTPNLAALLVLGANIGGSIAPYVALGSAPAPARRVALGNLVARTIVALLVVPLLIYLPDVTTRLSADAARQVLHFHTAFNMAVAIAFLPLLDPLARLVEWLVPAPHAPLDRSRPQHLDPTVLETPSEALACAMRETLNVGDIVLDMLRRALTALERSDPRFIKEIERDDDRVDSLHEEIKLYLIRASKTEMGLDERRRYVEILAFNTNLEHIGDIIDKNLMELAHKRIKKGVSFSTEGFAEITRLHGAVIDNMRLALNVFATRDVQLARRLLEEKSSVRAREFDAAERHFDRLRSGRADSLETSSIHLDIIRDLKRINSHLTSVAYPILEQAGELADSRLRKRADTEARELAVERRKGNAAPREA